MREDKFLETLLELLDNEQVAGKIRTIVNEKKLSGVAKDDDTLILQHRLDESDNEKKQLLSELHALEAEKNRVIKDYNDLCAEFDFFRVKYDKEIVVITKKLKEEKNRSEELESEFSDRIKPFLKIEKVLRAYDSLPAKVKTSFKNLLGKGTVEDFVACGLRLTYLQNMWETIRLMAMNEEYDVVKKLSVIFDYAADVYKNANDSAERLSVKNGEQFDDKTQIHCEGKNRVKITEVLIKGLSVKGEISLKSIVR